MNCRCIGKKLLLIVIKNSKQKNKSMKPHQMKYILKNAMVSALVAIFFAASAFCMEDGKRKALTPQEKSTQLLPFLFSIDSFDHKSLCVLARLNTSWHASIKETAPQRKHYIEQSQQFSDSESAGYTWHPYGSAYAFIQSHSKGWVNLHYVYLDCTKQAKCLIGMCEKGAQLFDGFERPLFDETGDVRFYYIKGYYEDPEVVELSFSENGVGYDYYCAISLAESSRCQKLSLFSSLPNLFRAFINSSVVVDNVSFDNQRLWKTFDLQGVIIPDNYQKYGDSRVGPSFEQLPEVWQEAIVKRYTIQQIVQKFMQQKRKQHQ
jgi:hypothetical protein